MDDYHLERLRQAAENNGLTCLSSQWQGGKARYRFRCARGHEWTRAGDYVFLKPDIACEDCRKADRLAQLQQVAQDRGGVCLETAYLGCKPYRFRCAHGHEWQATPSSLLKGTWCKRCAAISTGVQQRLEDGLQRLQRIAKSHGGLCLSDRYLGGRHRYRFRCARGHEWETLGWTILSGGCWCHRCASLEKVQRYRLADGLDRLRAAAVAKGGECLADHYVDSTTRYRFRCAKGHEWEAPGNRVMRGSWCIVCRGLDRRLGIERMREVAAARGGRCLSDEYANTLSKLQWQCHRGHTWTAIPGTVLKGSWCPTCANMDRIHAPDSKAWHKYRKAGHLSPDD